MRLLQFSNVISQCLTLLNFFLNSISSRVRQNSWWDKHQSSQDSSHVTDPFAYSHRPPVSTWEVMALNLNLWGKSHKEKYKVFKKMCFLVPNFIHMLLIAKKSFSKEFPSTLLPAQMVKKGWITLSTRNRACGLNIRSPNLISSQSLPASRIHNALWLRRSFQKFINT